MAAPKIKVTSSAFGHEEKIPKKYTCDGEDISPPLSWSGVPTGVKSIAVISDDPDAPMKTWVHWVVYNLPPDTAELPEGMPTSETLHSSAKQGITDFGRTGYGGPCPPSGTHRYYFKVFALDTVLDLKVGARKSDVIEAMEGHVLAEGELMGKYKRS